MKKGVVLCFCLLAMLGCKTLSVKENLAEKTARTISDFKEYLSELHSTKYIGLGKVNNWFHDVYGVDVESSHDIALKIAVSEAEKNYIETFQYKGNPSEIETAYYDGKDQCVYVFAFIENK